MDKLKPGEPYLQPVAEIANTKEEREFDLNALINLKLERDKASLPSLPINLRIKRVNVNTPEQKAKADRIVQQVREDLIDKFENSPELRETRDWFTFEGKRIPSKKSKIL